MKRFKSHTAILNVRTDGKKTRLAITVQAKLAGWNYLAVKLPGGEWTQSIAPEDLLTVAGAPFSLSALRVEQQEIEDVARKAKKARATKKQNKA